ncbi:MAG: class I SAM-dependent methyltransferase [Planctomycetota bacterium]|jgi:extracellular factor (EF) 3-hydroxypalmitic acid methyl ester biosynthesis protein
MSESVDDVAQPQKGVSSSQFVRALNAFTHDLSSIEKDIEASGTSQLDDSLYSRLSETVQTSIEACREFESQCGGDKEGLLQLQTTFRREIYPFFKKCWSANRAMTKPTGFPGDFEMLCKIYGDKRESTGLGVYLEHLFMELPLAWAVRGRLEMAREFLTREVETRGRTREPIRILDIASGPCREYINWPSRLPAIDVLAMDSDPRAIEYVTATVAPQMPNPSRLSNIQYNAFRTRSSEATIQKFGKFDIIYSVGLCDYLTDDVLVKLLSAWHETLSDNGVLFVAFKDTGRYDQTIYQWHFDWFFYQRTVKDVLELYEKAGFDLGNIETTRDETGIITGFFTRRDRMPNLRIDTAEKSVRKPTLRLLGTRPSAYPSAMTTGGAPSA